MIGDRDTTDERSGPDPHDAPDILSMRSTSGLRTDW